MARRYARDNRGRFAGGGGGATARGGRLKTAAGNKRATQTMQSGAAPKGTVSKPKGLKPGAIKAKSQVSPARQRGDTAAVNIPMRGSRGRALNAEISRNVAQQKATSRAVSKTANRKFKSEQSRAKKMREVHEKAVVGKYSAKMGKPASEIRGAIRSMEPSKQIKLFKQFVKENRATAKKAKKV